MHDPELRFYVLTCEHGLILKGWMRPAEATMAAADHARKKHNGATKKVTVVDLTDDMQEAKTPASPS